MNWKSLHGKQKIQYIWDYYKLPIVVFLIFLYIIGYTVHGHFSKKETLLYIGLVNVSAGEQLTTELSDGFIDFIDADASKEELKLYTGLFLTDDPHDPNHAYADASRLKILASIDDEQLDIVLMNKEAFDAFSQNEYLCEIEDYPEGILISQKGIFKNAGISGDVYLGVVKNSPRLDMAAEYINYLSSEQCCDF
ncbi:MAG: hypothetical protein HFG41_03220 [Coprococcus sp.]|nr:hypothetical protein [Coprococcus sp.]